MNNIDILEDLLSTQKQYIEDKDYQKEHNINEQAINYLKRWAKAIETLIAENKELKETVEKRNNKIYELLDRSINALKLINKEEVKQDYIPKSKVEGLIEELDIEIQCCTYADDDVEEYKQDIEKEKARLLRDKKTLQSLLEKE